MTDAQYIYGLELEDLDGVRKLHTITCDGELVADDLERFAVEMSGIYGCTPSDIKGAMYMFEADDGTPATLKDLYEEIEVDYGDETPTERIARLEAQADIEAAEQLSAMSA